MLLFGLQVILGSLPEEFLVFSSKCAVEFNQASSLEEALLSVETSEMHNMLLLPDLLSIQSHESIDS